MESHLLACNIFLFFPSYAHPLSPLRPCFSPRSLAHRSADIPSSMPAFSLSLPAPCLEIIALGHPMGLKMPPVKPENFRISGNCRKVWKGVVISRWAHNAIQVDSWLTWQGTAGRGPQQVLRSAGPKRRSFLLIFKDGSASANLVPPRQNPDIGHGSQLTEEALVEFSGAKHESERETMGRINLT